MRFETGYDLPLATTIAKVKFLMALDREIRIK